MVFFSLRGFVLAALWGCTVLGTDAHAQAPNPDRPIRVIVPSTPGSPPDVVARFMLEAIRASGRSAIVENRPGAGFTIGLHGVVKATADGHTFGVIAMPAIIAPFLLQHVPYDVLSDLMPVSQVVWNSNILVVRASAGLRSVSELVSLAKSKPGQLVFASGGIGTPAHMAGEFFKQRAAINVRHVPYKGAVAGVTAVLGDEIDLMFAATPAVAAHIRTEKLRALATPAPQRIPAYPDLPTVAESGFLGFDVRDWQGIVAPVGTPNEVISKMTAHITTMIRSIFECDL